MAWLDRARPDERIPTLEALVGAADNPTFFAAADALRRQLYAPDPSTSVNWDGRKFSGYVATARKRYRKGRATARDRQQELPPLNPSA